MTMSNYDVIISRISDLNRCRSSQRLFEESLYVQGLINGLKLAEDVIGTETAKAYERLNKALGDKVNEITERLISCH